MEKWGGGGWRGQKEPGWEKFVRKHPPAHKRLKADIVCHGRGGGASQSPPVVVHRGGRKSISMQPVVGRGMGRESEWYLYGDGCERR